jgi:hypothetical protein
VLAFPYEALMKQYTEKCQGELYLGDLPPDVDDPLANAMTVDLDRPTWPALSIRKVFRVFALNDSEACTLFYISMKMEILLFSDSDPVELCWKFDRKFHQRKKCSEACEAHPSLLAEGSTGLSSSRAACASSNTKAVVGAPDPQQQQQERQEKQSAQVSLPAPPQAPANGACSCFGASGGFHKQPCRYYVRE